MDLESDGSYNRTQPTCILVTGLGAGIKDATGLLEKYFSDAGRSGGGPLEGSVQFTDQSSALVCFTDPNVTSKVLGQDQHWIDVYGERVRLNVTSLSQAEKERRLGAAGARDNKSGSSLQQGQETERERTVIVEGFAGEMPDEEYLELILEGEDENIRIENIVLDAERKRATVLLATSKMADELIETSIDHDDVELLVYRPGVSECKSKTVELTGITQQLTEQILQLLFSKKRRSGGGPIDNASVDYETGTARLTFCNQEDADEVVARGSHEYKGVTLQAHYCSLGPAAPKHQQPVKTAESSPPTQTSEETKPDDDVTTVEILGIPLDTDTDTLEIYLESFEKSEDGVIGSTELDINNGRALITFKKPEIARKFLAKQTLEYFDSTLLVRTPLPDEQGKFPRGDVHCLVEVFGIEGHDASFIKGFFENKPLSGGGPISEIIPGQHTTTIRFKQRHDADEVVKKGTVTVGAQTWIVKPLSPGYCKPNETACTLEVRGISAKTKEQILRMYFENPVKSKGGEIANLEYKQGSGVAFVTFKEPETALRVLQQKGLTLSGCPLDVSRHSETGAHATQTSTSSDTDLTTSFVAPTTTCAIQVKNVDPAITKRRLELFFKNERRSGGGEIEEIFYDEEGRAAVITFKDPAVVERILAQKSLTLEDKHIKVLIMEAAPMCQHPNGETDPHLLLFQHLRPNVSTEDLNTYLNKHGQSEVVEVNYGVQPGVALVQFETPPDYEVLRNACSMKPLKDGMISVAKVEKAKTIQVHNVKEIGRETVEMYFEDTIGGNVNTIDENEEEDYLILEFESPLAVANILEKRPHAVDGKGIEVRVYLDGLGVFPPGYDTSRPSTTIPPHIDVEITPSSILQFWIDSKKTRQDIEAKLATQYCCIAWPKNAQDPLRLRCNLDREVPNVQSLAKTWEGNVKDKLLSIREEFDCKFIQPPRETWEAFLEKGGGWAPEDKDILDIQLQEDRREVHLVGKLNEVRNKELEIEKVLDAMNREASSITDTIKLSPSKLRLLEAHNIVSVIREKIPCVLYNIGNNEIVVKGDPEDIDKAKIITYEHSQIAIDSSLKLSAGLNRLVSRKDVLNFLTGELRSQGPIVVMETCEDGLKLCSQTEEDLEQGREILNRLLCEDRVPVSKKNSFLLQGQEWKQFEDELTEHDFKSIQVESTEEGKSIIIGATRDVIEDAKKEVEQFLKAHTVKETFLETSPGRARFIGKHMKKEQEDIRLSLPEGSLASWSETERGICLEGASVIIEVLWKQNKHGIHLQGSATALESAIRRMHALVDQVQQMTHEVRKMGMEKVFSGSKGEDFCSVLENKEEATIDIIQNLPSDEKSRVHSKQPEVKSWVKIGNATLKAIKGDLARYRADAIVNAANEDLQHRGGLARDIVVAGGETIQLECDGHVRAKGKVLPGNIFVSKPGKLECSILIHAVGPEWKDGSHGEENILFDVTYESIKTAGLQNAQSIAMPLLSTGIFQFPLPEASHTVLSAIGEYFGEGNKHPVEVHIVNNDERSLNILHEVMLEQFGRENVHLSEEKSIVKPKGISRSRRRKAQQGAAPVQVAIPRPVSQPVAQPVPQSAPALFKQIGQRKVTGVTGGISVSLAVGLIEKQEVDVIVNTTSHDFDLTQGAVSTAILNAGGQSLQSEITESAKGGVPPGGVVTTSGGNLQCKKVYHGALEGWDGSGGRGEMVLRQFLQNCLAKADADAMASIAVPPLGTGNLLAPTEEVAKIMLEEIGCFDNKNVGTKIRNVVIVIYHKDQTKVSAFEVALSRSAGRSVPSISSKTSSDQPIATGGYSSRDKTREKEMMAPAYQRQQRQNTGKGLPDEQTIYVGDLALLIRQGDITLERTDVIVNSTNEQLDISAGGVQGAIMSAAGPDVVKQCRVLGQTKQGIAVTTAGNLPAKCIIHTAPEDPRDAASWIKVVRKALEQAEKTRLCSIAFPALGTGNNGAPAVSMANSMFEGLVQFVEKEKPKHLLTVHFTIFDPTMVQVFIETVKTKVEEKTKAWTFGGIWRQSPSIRIGASGRRGQLSSDVGKRTENVGDIAARVVLRIHALTQDNIDKVVQQIDDFCRNESKDYVIDKPEDQELIKKLSAEQIQRVEALGETHCVVIRVDQKKRTNRIRIQGEIEATMQAWQDVQKILQEVLASEKELEKAKIIAQQVQWSYAEDDSFLDYDPDINMMIETAHQNKQREVQWHEKEDVYRINFRAMHETLEDDGSSVEVRRCVLSKEELPPNWNMSPTDRHKLVTLSSSDKEYNKVEKEFFETAGSGSKWTIVKIERVQNPDLYLRYETHRKQMEGKNPKTKNEKILWHGTAPDARVNINAGGFNRSYCGKNATYYGEGVYFAVQTEYSAQDRYSAKDKSQGHKYIYRAKVLTGCYTTGTEKMKEPPEKNPNAPGDRYDSVVNDMKNIEMFVIFTDTQAYPEHLITFK